MNLLHSDFTMMNLPRIIEGRFSFALYSFCFYIMKFHKKSINWQILFFLLTTISPGQDWVSCLWLKILQIFVCLIFQDRCGLCIYHVCMVNIQSLAQFSVDQLFYPSYLLLYASCMSLLHLLIMGFFISLHHSPESYLFKLYQIVDILWYSVTDLMNLLKALRPVDWVADFGPLHLWREDLLSHTNGATCKLLMAICNT